MSSAMKGISMKWFKLTVSSSLSLGFKQLAGIFGIAAIAGGMVSPVIAGDGECVRPELIGSIGSATLSNFSYDAVLDGDLAYLVGYSTGLQIVDMSDPTQPVVVEVHNTIGGGARVLGIDVEGGYLYIADGDSGLLIYDLNDLSTNTLYQTPFGATGIVVVEDVAYVTYGRTTSQISGLEILDVSDPTMPILLGSYITDGFASGVTVEGTIVYVSDSDNGLVILDVGDPSVPQLLSTFPTSGRLRTDAAIVGNTVFVVSSNSGSSFQIIDVSDPTSPAMLGELDGVGSADIAVLGDVAIVGRGLTSKILDVSDLSNPTEVVSFPTSFPVAAFLDMDTALLMRGNGVRVFDISGELGGDCPPYCQVDMNADGELNFFDVSLFLHAYIARDPAADFTGTGTVDFHDISVFLGSYQAGCP